MTNKDRLSEKQSAFVDAYVENGGSDKVAALEAAGYSTSTKDVVASTAHRLLSTPAIRAAIDARRKELMNARGITPEAILNEFWRNHKDARKAGDYAPSNKALEHLARFHNLFEDDQKAGAVNIVVSEDDAKL